MHLQGLVDYEGDSDEEDDASMDTNDDVVAGTPVVATEPTGPPLTPPPDDADNADSPTRQAKRPRLS